MADGIQSQVQGFGSPGASAFFGVQQELMRRAALAEEQGLREAALKRQAEQDALQAQAIQQQIAASKENVASSVEQRAAMAARNQELATKTAQENLLKTLKPGEVSPDVRDQASKIGLGHLFLAQPKVVTPETLPAQVLSPVPGETATTAAPIIPAEVKGETVTFQGTPEQQQLEEQKAMAKRVIAGEFDTNNDALNQWNKARAMELLQTGKTTGSGPAAGIIAPRTPSETTAAHNLKLESILAKPESQRTPEEQALVSGRKAYNALQGEEASRRQQITINTGDKRADARFTEQARKAFATDLMRDRAPIRQMYERAERAEQSLKNHTAVEDAVAIPEFLSVEAGGMGSGLRMTEAEIRKVQEAQTLVSRAKAAFSTTGLAGNQFMLDDTIRKQMDEALALILKKAKQRLEVIRTTQDKLKDVTDPDEVYGLRSKYWGEELEAGNIAGDHAPAAGKVKILSITPVK